jgi:hypothetical protein
MILSQIDIEPWHIYSIGFTGITYAALKVWLSVRKQKQDERRDDMQTEFYKRTAVATEEGAKTMAVMNERLQHVCKANCPTK